jgi:CRP-like cAMP-binding protein
MIVPAAAHHARQNLLLAALPDTEFLRLAPHLEPIAMRVGDILYEPGSRLRRFQFPTTGVVSLHYVLESGASAESAGVGVEGMVGVSLFMGGETTPSSATVQVAGRGYALDPLLLQREFARSQATQRVLLGYTQLLMAQMIQTAACNRHHSVQQQICRWLLTTLDRVGPREIVVTQEMIAAVLGVRRESVTGVAGDLQRAGLIVYRRGHIQVRDRAGLQRRVCECYGAIRRQMPMDGAALQLSGQVEQAAGPLQKAIGDVRDLARDSLAPPRK